MVGRNAGRFLIVVRTYNKNGVIEEWEGEYQSAQDLFFNSPSIAGVRPAFRKLRDPVYAEHERARNRRTAALRKQRRHDERDRIRLLGGLESVAGEGDG